MAKIKGKIVEEFWIHEDPRKNSFQTLLEEYMPDILVMKMPQENMVWVWSFFNYSYLEKIRYENGTNLEIWNPLYP